MIDGPALHEPHTAAAGTQSPLPPTVPPWVEAESNDKNLTGV
jgi:hypothetical protein